MQFIFTVISFISICLTGALLVYCFANAALRIGRRNLNNDLKWFLEKAASLDAYLVFTLTISIIIGLRSSLNHISNHIILSLDIIFFFNCLVLILFQTIKQTGFAHGK